MSLFLKNVKKLGRSMYLYYPDIPRHGTDLVRLITVIRGDATLGSAESLLDRGFRELAEEGRFVIAFPNPTEAGWNAELDPGKQDDLAAIWGLLDEVAKEDDEPIRLNANGIPLLEEMLRQWHIYASDRHLVGVDGGADMAVAYAACRPEQVASLLALGGRLTERALKSASYSPVTAVLAGCPEETKDYFRKVCGCEEETHEPGKSITAKSGKPACVETSESEACLKDAVISRSPLNPDSFVLTLPERELSPEFLWSIHDVTLGKLRKINTGKRGDMHHVSDLSGDEFTWYKEDDRLGDTKHTWLVHVPAGLEAGEKVPLVVFYHGGSDSPVDSAHMSMLHELARKERFITVYPWGTNRAGWNINYDPTDEFPEGNEDEIFGVLLIDWMLRNYPIDAGRVYLSGFSNGAAMAQVIAMLYPEKIAGIFHIDSNWPGDRFKPSEVDLKEVPAMWRALEKKADSMRMPVWYTYGTREPSCPAYRGCTQQHQYDFWKRFNNIEIGETPELGSEDLCECGVPGQQVEEIHPNPACPEQFYTVNRFWTRDDEPQNYYNYVLMHEKGHYVAPMDPVLGWNYVKQFRRNPDGSVGRA